MVILLTIFFGFLLPFGSALLLGKYKSATMAINYLPFIFYLSIVWLGASANYLFDQETADDLWRYVEIFFKPVLFVLAAWALAYDVKLLYRQIK
jgi:hypothetical protein